MTPEGRKEHLLRIAIQEFAVNGVAHTSVAQITRAAGVSNGIFYHYFSDKADLEGQVAQRVVSELVDRLTTLQQPLDYPERVATGALIVLKQVADQPKLGAILAGYFSTGHEAVTMPLEGMTSDINAGHAAGDFPVAFNPLLPRFWAVIFGTAARDIVAGADYEQTADLVARTHLRMLEVPADRIAAALHNSWQVVNASAD